MVTVPLEMAAPGEADVRGLASFATDVTAAATIPDKERGCGAAFGKGVFSRAVERAAGLVGVVGAILTMATGEPLRVGLVTEAEVGVEAVVVTLPTAVAPAVLAGLPAAAVVNAPVLVETAAVPVAEVLATAMLDG